MHARFSYIAGQADRLDDAVADARDNVVPMLQDLDGFKGFSLFVDRSSGQMVGLSYWESEDAMRASEEAVRESRDRVAKESGADQARVAHFEVALDTEA